MDNLEERDRSERKAGLACGETWEREVPKASGFDHTRVLHDFVPSIWSNAINIPLEFFSSVIW